MLNFLGLLFWGFRAVVFFLSESWPTIDYNFMDWQISRIVFINASIAKSGVDIG